MAGFIIGAILAIFGAIDRHLGHALTGDIENAIGMLCIAMQFGVNAIVEAVRK